MKARPLGRAPSRRNSRAQYPRTPERTPTGGSRFGPEVGAPSSTRIRAAHRRAGARVDRKPGDREIRSVEDAFAGQNVEMALVIVNDFGVSIAFEVGHRRRAPHAAALDGHRPEDHHAIHAVQGSGVPRADAHHVRVSVEAPSFPMPLDGRFECDRFGTEQIAHAVLPLTVRETWEGRCRRKLAGGAADRAPANRGGRSATAHRSTSPRLRARLADRPVATEQREDAADLQISNAQINPRGSGF